MVFGGYIAAGGKLGIILKALPFELMMIGGGRNRCVSDQQRYGGSQTHM